MKIKQLFVSLALTLSLLGTAYASDREESISRAQKAGRVFKEVMNTPEGIPSGMLNTAKCIAVIPGAKKIAFVVGVSEGKGVATCRNEAGSWSAPLFIALKGGSFGWQIGGSSTDLVLLFMNDRALNSLLTDKFKLGADASIAAGPVGRDAAADTDAAMSAEILSYSRSKGVFIGVSLTGAVVEEDVTGNESMYGDVNRHEILKGRVPAPASADVLLHELEAQTK